MTEEKYGDSYGEKFRKYEDRIADLEKQNKEQQEQNEILAKHILELQADKGRLTDENRQAKEIIRELLGCLQQDTNDPETNYYVVNYMDKAEAFINKE